MNQIIGLLDVLENTLNQRVITNLFERHIVDSTTGSDEKKYYVLEGKRAAYEDIASLIKSYQKIFKGDQQ